MSPPRGCRGHFLYSAAGFCCLPDCLGAVMVSVTDVVGMEELSATVLSTVTALTALTMSSCSGFDKQVQSAEGCWLRSDANLACT